MYLKSALLGWRLLWTFVAIEALTVSGQASEPTVRPKVVRVRQLWELRRAVNEAMPGTRIEIEPGEYDGGFFATNLHGNAGNPIIITAADLKRPPDLPKAETNCFYGTDPQFRDAPAGDFRVGSADFPKDVGAHTK